MGEWEERLARIEVKVDGIKESVDRVNGGLKVAHERMDEHARDDEAKHGQMWSAIAALRVRDAYSAGVMFVLMMVFGGILAWILK